MQAWDAARYILKQSIEIIANKIATRPKTDMKYLNK
jgi:hypothetical protein